jgi:tetratricopeptide (TPR) repeat protein
MKKIILITITIFLGNFCFAQTENVDSLLNLLNHHQKEDTAKVTLMNKLAFAYTYSDFTKGRLMTDQAIALANYLQDKSGLAEAFFNKGSILILMAYLNNAFDTLQKALGLFEQLKDARGRAKTLSNLSRTTDPAKGFYFLFQSLKIADSLHDPELLGDLYNNFGNAYKVSNNFPIAIDYYQKALNEYEHDNNQYGIGRVHVNIGNAFAAMKEFEKAIENYNKSYAIFIAIRYEGGISNVLGNMGAAYRELGYRRNTLMYHTMAVDFFQKALIINTKLGAKGGIEWDVDNLGVLYNEIGNYDKAMDYSKQALTFYESQSQLAANVAKSLTDLANSIILAPNKVLKKHGIDPVNRYSIALTYQHRARQLSAPTRDFEEQSYEWKTLSLIYEKQRRYDSSLYAFKKFYIANDSLFDMEKRNEITRKSLQYDFNKREDSLKSQQQKKQSLAKAEIVRQKAVKNEIAGVGVTLLLTSIISFIFYKRRRDAKQRQKDAEFNAKVSDTEMKALRSQMNPHFIFNSLNSISDYIKKNNIGAADDYLVKFSQLMRLILENSEKKEVCLSSDLKALELYMQLESERLNNKFTYQVTIDKDIDADNTLIPPLILQPFVENSIWHGIADKQGDGKISIYIKKEGGMINCIVEDDGVGLQNITDEKKGKKSLGMKITHARIDILNKTKNANASLQLFSLKQGTRAEVKLPLQLSF